MKPFVLAAGTPHVYVKCTCIRGNVGMTRLGLQIVSCAVIQREG